MTRGAAWFCLFLLGSSAALPRSGGADAGGERLVIRNVRLIDGDGETEDRSVSLVVEQGALALVTAEEVHTGELDRVLDAAGGVALGMLDVGRPASFLILDQDPRQNVEVLLDTKAHVVFAMKAGVILEDLLGEAREAPPPDLIPG